MKRNAVKICVASILLAGLAGCGGGGGGSGGGGTVAVSGVAQGPLVSGTVTIQNVTSPITTSALGVFSATVPSNSNVDLKATGSYFDEVLGKVSTTSTLTLNSFASSSDSALNINILTTLAYQRIKTLMAAPNSLSFSAARSKAEKEVLAAFYIRDQPLPTNSPVANTYYGFGSFDLSKGRDEDKMLAAISSAFEYSGNSSTTSLIANFQSDIASNGTTAAATANTLATNAIGIITATVATNLNIDYKNFTATDISNWLDQDGDQVIGKYKYKAVQASNTFTFGTLNNMSYTVGVSDNGASYSFSTTTPNVCSSLNPSCAIYPLTNSTCAIAVNNGALSSSAQVATNDSIAVACTPTPHEVSSTYLQSVPSGTSTPINIARYDFTPFALTKNPIKNARTYATATTLSDGTVLVAGGLVGTTATKIVELYDPGTETWTTVGAMKNARAGHTATLLNSGKVLVVGGDGTNDTAELYDPIGQTWTSTASPACGRTYHTATLLPNGQVMIAGGAASVSKTCLNGGATSPNALASLEFYDPTSSTWDFKWVVATAPTPQTTPAPLGVGTILTSSATVPTTNSLIPMSTARYNHTATYVPDSTGATGGWVLIAGGFDGNIALTNTDLITITPSSTPLVSPPVYTFNSTPINLNTPSFSHSATLLTASGSVLLAGGSSGASGAALQRAEIISPSAATPTWTTIASLNTPRVRHIAQLLSDGQILIAGGSTSSNSSSSSNALASVELYNSGTFTVNGNLANARDALVASPITVNVNSNPVSQVLLVGGKGVTAAETFQ